MEAGQEENRYTTYFHQSIGTITFTPEAAASPENAQHGHHRRLAVASKHGVIAFADQEVTNAWRNHFVGVHIAHLRNLLSAATKGEEEQKLTPANAEEVCACTLPMSDASLAISSEEDLLAAWDTHTIKVWSLGALTQRRSSEPLTEWLVPDGTAVKQLDWRPYQALGAIPEVVVLTEGGQLFRGILGDQLQPVPVFNADRLSCIAYSADGSLVAFASASDVTVQHLESGRHFQMNFDIKDAAPLAVMQWSTWDIEAGAKPEDLQMMECIAADMDPSATAENSGPYTHVACIPAWDAAVVAHSKASDEQIRLYEFGQGYVKQIDLTEDCSAIRIPSAIDGSDNYVTGLGMDFTSTDIKVVPPGRNASALPPSPVLLVVTSDGALHFFTLAHMTKSTEGVVAPALPLPGAPVPTLPLERQEPRQECDGLADYATNYFARAEPRATSDELRAQGNKQYTSIHDGLPPTIFAWRLQGSIDLYTKAVKSASTPEQMASASKNLGFAHRKHAYKEGNFDGRMCHLCIAVGHLCNAYVFGAACKPATWCAPVSEDVTGCVEAIKDGLFECGFKQRLRWLEKLSAAVPDAWASLKASVSLFHADDVVKEAPVALTGEGANHKLCKHLMEEAARPIEEALRYSRVAGDTEGYNEAVMLKDEAYLYICICTAAQERKNADAILERALYGTEDINMDLVFLAIDAYRNVILLSREKDLAAECIAFSRLGRVYGKIMKDRQRAADCNKRCIVLADAIYPVPYTADWYREATTALREEQQRKALEEEEKQAQERVPILESLKEELAALKKAHAEGAHKLVDLIYKEHPPKKEDACKPDVNGENMKKGLQAAILHYHPDKNSEVLYGKQWSILCEEITKLLNEKYQHTKGS